MQGWVRTPSGVVVPGYVPVVRNDKQHAGPPRAPQPPPSINRAERRRLERVMRKEAKRAARRRAAVGS